MRKGLRINMSNRLLLTQTQKLAVTANMQQSLHILQSSNMELIEFINRQADENPVLEVDFGTMLHDRGRGRARSSASAQEYDPIAMAANAAPTLEQHLLRQLNCLTGLPAGVYEAAKYMIGNLDDNGYLTLPLEQLAEDLGVSPAIVGLALNQVQELDPAGVGARNMKECLLIQLRLTYGEDSLVYRLADGHLEDLAAGRIKRIAKALKADADEIREAACRLTALVPRPGATFQFEKPHYVVPDIVIEQREEGFDIHIGSISKSVTINSFYKGMSERAAAGDPEARFLKEKLSSAEWLLKCLSQREKTLRLVAEAVVEAQAEFFRTGKGGLAPLTLKEVADRIGMHESTVSRTVAGKFAQTPRGIFELKYFFASGVYVSEGSAVSADHIKRKIKELIRSENAAKPRSDQQLAEALLGAGLSISRRTVAKYREEMGIAPSSRRAARS